MEHNAEYMEGRYRVVEQIERVKDGFQVTVMAYDDQTAKELLGAQDPSPGSTHDGWPLR